MFVDAIGTERYSTTIIETLIDLARNMRMEIFAEGVETFEQVKYLRERGILLAQGYAFAPPLPGSLFRQLLEAAHPLGNGGGPQATWRRSTSSWRRGQGCGGVTLTIINQTDSCAAACRPAPNARVKRNFRLPLRCLP